MITDTWRASFCEELADISKLIAITRTLIIIEGDLSTDSVNYFIEAQKKFKSAAQNLRTTVLNDKKIMTQPSPSCGCGTHDIRETFRWPSATCYDARDAQAAGLRLADAIDNCRDVLPTSDLTYLLWAAEIACKQLRDAAETIENMHCIIQDLQQTALLNRQKKSRKKTS